MPWLALMLGLSLGGKPAPVHQARLSRLENATLQVAVDLNLGGAITSLIPKSTGLNLVNNWDWGRQIQMSYYSGPVPFLTGKKAPADHWRHLGWNPVQAGDDFRHPGRVLEARNDGQSMYTRSVPMQWPLDDVPGECEFESWILLDGPTVAVRCRMTNKRSDRTQYPARMQELPAVYVNGPYHRLMTYSGAKPFTNDSPTQIVKRRNEPGPWSTWHATEHWAALVNDSQFGLGVWNPGCTLFSGGFAGQPGAGGERDSPTGYIAPNRIEVIDHNIVHEYEYRLIVGRLDEIRAWVGRRRPGPSRPPRYEFTRDRQGWWYVNATDAGWPIRGELSLKLDQKDPQLIGPAGAWAASDAPVLVIHAAFQTTHRHAQIFWSTLTAPGFDEKRSMTFPIIGDGKFRTYEVPLSSSVEYRGLITGLRLDPVPNGTPSDSLRVRSIGFGGP